MEECLVVGTGGGAGKWSQQVKERERNKAGSARVSERAGKRTREGEIVQGDTHAVMEQRSNGTPRQGSAGARDMGKGHGRNRQEGIGEVYKQRDEGESSDLC